jgi:hypothetical protein
MAHQAKALVREVDSVRVHIGRRANAERTIETGLRHTTVSFTDFYYKQDYGNFIVAILATFGILNKLIIRYFCCIPDLYLSL